MYVSINNLLVSLKIAVAFYLGFDRERVKSHLISDVCVANIT
jgi:hypothetical protein